MHKCVLHYYAGLLLHDQPPRNSKLRRKFSSVCLGLHFRWPLRTINLTTSRKCRAEALINVLFRGSDGMF